VLVLIVLVGAGVRLNNLNRHSITHVEMYVPGIRLPADLVEFPLPRLTLAKVVSGCIRAEPHPPLYYMLMLGWTSLFGTGVLALRLPSALCGIACIPLVYALGVRESGKATGLLAAAMLALNGHQLFWSQFRGYIGACLCGLASTVFLLKLVRDDPRSLRSLFLYCVFLFMGLAAEVYFWPIFLTQMLWVAVQGAQQPRTPALLRWQIWVFLSASPLWALAAHQSQLPSHGAIRALPFLSQFLNFGFLFEEHVRFGYAPGLTGATRMFSLVGITLAVIGLASRNEAGLDPRSREDGTNGFASLLEPPVWMWACAAVVALSAILTLGGCSYLWGGKRTGPILATAVLPLLLVLADRVVRSSWPKLHRTFEHSRLPWPDGLLTLSGLLAIVPITMILVASNAISVLASRGALLYAPYLMLIVSRGLVILAQRNRGWLLLVVAVAIAHVLSLIHARDVPMNPRDYRALSTKLASRVQEPDLILVRGKHWQTTPIFYYLNPERYHFIGKDYSRAIAAHPDSRIWALSWENRQSQEMTAALTGYRPTEEIAVPGAQAVLMNPP
jgi:4-amino-4-deoxy-L-arabinose transferase-like glycosyltransferase